MPRQSQPNSFPQTNYRPVFNVPPPPIRPRGHAVVDTNQKYSNPIQHGQNFNFPPPFMPPPGPFFSQGYERNSPSLGNNYQQQNFFQAQTPFLDSQYSLPMQPDFQPTTVSQMISAMQSDNEASVEVTSQKKKSLNEFLQKFQQKSKDNVKNDMTIPEFRTTLKMAFTLTKMLQSNRQDLLTVLESSSEEWETKKKQAIELQNKLSEICAVLSNPRTLSTIDKKLKVIRRKRILKKRLKENVLCEKIKKEQERKKFHLEIDKWLDNLKEKNEKLKREMEMKKEADNILSEVRRKIHETKKTLERLKIFEKLRSARQNNAMQKGFHIGKDHDVKFEEKMITVRHIMQEQLSSYEKEEKALQVMLETEQEDRLEEEANWRRKKMMTLQQKKQNTILECIFGVSGWHLFKRLFY
ncbi:uncharacterized protein TNCV_4430071 [Trichonephila clavipes]|nr:uncharacterized protein TNCV_4430071 [Trichonephila clavipes]